MQAIIVTGGKQYVVNEGDTLFIEKLPVEAGDAVTFVRHSRGGGREGGGHCRQERQGQEGPCLQVQGQEGLSQASGSSSALYQG